MLRPTATKVIPLEDFTLRVSFDTGETRDFDVKPYIRGNWYGEFADPAYFRSAFANGYTVEWANGQDICPDELYYGSVAVAEEWFFVKSRGAAEETGGFWL